MLQCSRSGHSWASGGHLYIAEAFVHCTALSEIIHTAVDVLMSKGSRDNLCMGTLTATRGAGSSKPTSARLLPLPSWLSSLKFRLLPCLSARLGFECGPCLGLNRSGSSKGMLSKAISYAAAGTVHACRQYALSHAAGVACVLFAQNS